MNLFAGLSTLDPAYASDQSAIWMCGQLYNGLLELDTALQLQPAIATSWSLDSSGTRYSFKLRHDVYFHPDPLFGPDSTRKVVASDFKYSFERICNPEVAAKGFWIFNGKVKGLNAYREGQSPEVTGFVAENDSLFHIQLEAPFAPFPNLLAMAYGSVVPKEVVEHYGKDFRSHPIGTGPFKFKSWAEGSGLVLLRNARYFEEENGRKLPFVDAVQVRFIRERLSEFVELCEGRLHFVNGVDKSTKDEIFDLQGKVKPKYAESFQFAISPQLNTEFIGILVDSTLPALKGHPLAKKSIRKALNLAIDRKALVEYLLNGNGYEANSGMIPRGMPGFDDQVVKGFSYQPDQAAALLKEAGFPGGKGMPVISLKSTPAYQGVMEFVQKSWERIGLVVKIDNMDGGALREMASKGEALLWRASWIADYPDGENYLGLFASSQIPPNGPNRMRYNRPEFDQLFQQAQSEANDSIRFGLYHQMENMVLEDAAVIPLYYDKIVRIISPKVRGLETNATNMLYLKRVEVME